MDIPDPPPPAPPGNGGYQNVDQIANTDKLPLLDAGDTTCCVDIPDPPPPAPPGNGGYQNVDRIANADKLPLLDAGESTCCIDIPDPPPPAPPGNGGYQNVDRIANADKLPLLDAGESTCCIDIPDPPPPAPPGNGGYQNAAGAVQSAGMGGLVETSASSDRPRFMGNYPNPFNPSTTIRFSLANEEYVHLAVYNILGQQVRVLVDESIAAGQHEVRFPADALPSGLYLARLTTPTGSVVHSMMLAR